MRQETEGYGLPLEASEYAPIRSYDKAMLGQPGRDEQGETYISSRRNVARARIPTLGDHSMPNSCPGRLFRRT